MAALHIGTSGWNYPHWKGPFYPKDIRDEDLFPFYRRHFDTVEINNTFYSLPSQATVAGWRDQADEGFVYSVKASRYATHMKKLKDPRDSTERLFARIDGLSSRAEVVLFQLPPRWRRNTERLQSAVEALPDTWRYAFEFRDPDWFHEETYETLRNAGAAFCVFEIGDLVSPREATADFVYMRLHGPGDRYEGSYDDEALSRRAREIEAHLEAGRDVWVYFDNDEKGYAPANAARLKDLLT